MEPPPAATVSISSIGATMRTPAFSVSYSYAKSPVKRLTSVEVPPMSNPIARSSPAARVTSASATTPPAGPERMVSLPLAAAASTRPPALVIRRSRPSVMRSRMAAT